MTRSTCASSRLLWNGNARVRRAMSSVTGSIPSRVPKRSRMYGWEV